MTDALWVLSRILRNIDSCELRVEALPKEVTMRDWGKVDTLVLPKYLCIQGRPTMFTFEPESIMGERSET